MERARLSFLQRLKAYYLVLLVLLVPGSVLAGKNFNPSEHPEIMRLLSPADTNKVITTLKRAGANWQELAKAIQQAKPEYRPGMIALISTLRSVDLFSPTTEVLLQEVNYAYRARQDLPWQTPEEKFKNYVLPFRISSEWFIPWRAEFYKRFRPLVKDAHSAEEMAKIVNEWVKNNIELKSHWGGRWPMAPILTLKGKGGNQISVTVFTVAVLRSIGIPSRVVRVDFFGDAPGGTSWVEFFANNHWLPLYPHDPANIGNFRKISQEHPRAIPLVYAGKKEDVTSHYAPVGTLKVVIAGDDSLAGQRQKLLKSIDFSVGVFNDGSWRTVTDRMGFSFVADTTGAFQIRLGEGKYLAEAEIDKYLVFLKRFTIKRNETTTIVVKPKKYNYTKNIYDSYR